MNPLCVCPRARTHAIGPQIRRRFCPHSVHFSLLLSCTHPIKSKVKQWTSSASLGERGDRGKSLGTTGLAGFYSTCFTLTPQERTFPLTHTHPNEGYADPQTPDATLQRRPDYSRGEGGIRGEFVKCYITFCYFIGSLG